MKVLESIVLILLLSLSSSIIAQTTVKFSYDNGNGNTGNRTKREILVIKNIEASIDSNMVSRPVIETLDDMKICIYPNPTQGHVAVEITNLPANVTGEITIHDITGMLVQHHSAIIASNQLDLSDSPPGIYILRINIGQNVSEWKILKN